MNRKIVVISSSLKSYKATLVLLQTLPSLPANAEGYYIRLQYKKLLKVHLKPGHHFQRTERFDLV